MAIKKPAPETEETPTKSKGETRSFQTGSEPGQREELTKSEAEKRGFYWKDEPAPKKD